MTTYRIRSGTQEVTNAMNRALEDEAEAKRLAQEISAGQPDSTVTVESVSTEPMGEWTRTVATYVDGKPHPWAWEVTFLGYVEQTDQLRLSEAGISYMSGHPEPIPGGIREGAARHRVVVDAESGEEAVEQVRKVLGGQGLEMRDWTHEPAADEAIRFRLDDLGRDRHSQ